MSKQIEHHLHKDGVYDHTLYATPDEAEAYISSNGLTKGLHPEAETGVVKRKYLAEHWLARLEAVAEQHEADNHCLRWGKELSFKSAFSATRTTERQLDQAAGIEINTRITNMRDRCRLLGMGYRVVKKFENPSIAAYAVPLDPLGEAGVDQFISQIETEFKIPLIEWFFGHNVLLFRADFDQKKLMQTSSFLRPILAIFTARSADDWNELWVYFNKLRGAA